MSTKPIFTPRFIEDKERMKLEALGPDTPGTAWDEKLRFSLPEEVKPSSLMSPDVEIEDVHDGAISLSRLARRLQARGGARRT